MEITGRIIQVLPERGGVSARTGNEWKAGSYVLETLEQYPRKMVFDVFGADKLAQFNIQAGETMVVSFDIDAHEYNGRWFNSIRAWKVDRNLNQPQTSPVGAATPIPPFEAAPQQPAQPIAQPTQAPASPLTQNANDDLPF